MGIRSSQGSGLVQGKKISQKAYSELRACWDVLDQMENVVGKFAARRPQKTTATCQLCKASAKSSKWNYGASPWAGWRQLGDVDLLVTIHGYTTMVE